MGQSISGGILMSSRVEQEGLFKKLTGKPMTDLEEKMVDELTEHLYRTIYTEARWYPELSWWHEWVGK